MTKRILLCAMAVVLTFGMAEARKVKSVEEVQDPHSQEWKKSNQHTLTYKCRNLLSDVSYYFNIYDSVWSPTEKHEYTYDKKNRVVTETGYYYFSPKKSWAANYKIEYQYTSEFGTALKYKYLDYAGLADNWSLVEKRVFTLDKGRPVSSEVFSWNADKEEYTLVGRETYTLNAKGQPTEVVISTMDKEGTATPMRKNSWSYDRKGRTLTYSTEDLTVVNHTHSDDCVHSRAYRYTYNRR